MSASKPKKNRRHEIPETVIPCRVNDHEMLFEPDTGARQTNIFGLNHFREFLKHSNSRPILKTPSKTLTNASGIPMDVKGCFRAQLSSEFHSCLDVIYVLDHDVSYRPLLSEQSLLRLGYIKYSLTGAFACKSYNNSNKDSKRSHNFVNNVSEKEKDSTIDHEFLNKIESIKAKYKTNRAVPGGLVFSCWSFRLVVCALAYCSRFVKGLTNVSDKHFKCKIAYY